MKKNSFVLVVAMLVCIGVAHAQQAGSVPLDSLPDSAAKFHADSAAKLHPDSTAKFHADSTAKFHADSTAMLHPDSGASLRPVFAEFTATTNESNRVVLKWETDSASDGDYFVIERSPDETHYETIG